MCGQSYASLRDIMMDGFLSRAVGLGASPDQTQDMNNALTAIDNTKLLKSASFVFAPNAYSEGKAYAQFPNNGNGDFTFSRTTNATKVAKDGTIQMADPNIVLLPQWLDAVAGVGPLAVAPSSFSFQQTGGTLVLGSVTSDGFKQLSFSAASNRFFIQQSIQVQAGITYVFSVSLDATTNNLGPLQIFGDSSNINNTKTYYYQNGTNLGDGTAAVSNTGIYYMVYTCVTPATIGVRYGVGINSASTGTVTLSKPRVWTVMNSAFVPSANFGFPRVDYSTGVGCLLLEPTRRNLLKHSQDYSQSSVWVKTDTTVNPTSIVAPDNTLTGNLVTETLAANSGLSQDITSSITVFPVTTYLKYGTQVWVRIMVSDITTTTTNVRQWVNLQTGALGTSQANGSGAAIAGASISIVNGWYKITFNATFTGATGYTYQTMSAASDASTSRGSAGNTRYEWGKMIEDNGGGVAVNFPTSYIPTTTQSVTRGAESFTRNNIYTNNLIGATGGTWFVELKNNLILTRDNSNRVLCLGDSSLGSGSYQLFMYNSSGTGRLALYKNNAGAGGTSVFTTQSDNIKLVITWNSATNFLNVYQNGLQVVTNSDFIVDNAAHPMEYLVLPSAGGGVPAYISKMALWNTPLSDAECILITT